jgi:hypothetical protein
MSDDDEPIQLTVTVASAYEPPRWAITFELEDGSTQRCTASWSEGIPPPPGARRIVQIEQPPTVAPGGTITIGKRH